jgi:Yip1 domain
MASFLLSTRALLFPVDAVPSLVERRIWFFPLLMLCGAIVLSQSTIAQRLHLEPQVVGKLAADGELAKLSEHEIEEAVEQAQRQTLVLGVALGVIGAPMGLLLLAAALRFTAWLLSKKTTFMACFSAIAVAFMPIAIYHLILTYMAFRQPLMVPAQVPEMLSSSLAPVLSAVPGRFKGLLEMSDFFRLWSVFLLSLGLTKAFSMSWLKSLMLGLFLFVLFGLLYFVGIPAMAAGGGRP